MEFAINIEVAVVQTYKSGFSMNGIIGMFILARSMTSSMIDVFKTNNTDSTFVDVIACEN